MGARTAQAKEAVPTKGLVSEPTYGSPSHDYTLQTVMQIQRTIGVLECAVANLESKVDAKNGAIDEIKKTVSAIEKTIYAAGVILVISLGIGGWMISTAKDFAMTYYKASIEAQVKTVPPPK